MKRCCPELLPENQRPASEEEIAQRRSVSADDWISAEELKEAALRCTEQVADPFLRKVMELRFGLDRGNERRTPFEVADALGGKYAGDGETAHMLIRKAMRSIPMVADDPSNLQVIFEDDDLIAVYKPPFLRTAPVHRFIGKSLLNQLIGYMRKKAEEGGPPSVSESLQQPHQLHRLDQNTSGVVLYAKTKQAASFMHGHWHGPTCRKVYLAIATPIDPATSELSGPGDTVLADAPIGADAASDDQVRRAVDYGGGQSAVTKFTVLATGVSASGQRGSLLQCSLEESGRTHQIRVHAAHVGNPLLGDELYNPACMFEVAKSGEAGARQAAAAALMPRVALHAWRLHAPHPNSGEALILEAPPPADFLECLGALGIGWPLPALG